jgi:hypothetical protein
MVLRNESVNTNASFCRHFLASTSLHALLLCGAWWLLTAIPPSQVRWHNSKESVKIVMSDSPTYTQPQPRPRAASPVSPQKIVPQKIVEKSLSAPAIPSKNIAPEVAPAATNSEPQASPALTEISSTKEIPNKGNADASQTQFSALPVPRKLLGRGLFPRKYEVKWECPNVNSPAKLLAMRPQSEPLAYVDKILTNEFASHLARNFPAGTKIQPGTRCEQTADITFTEIN